MSTADAKSLFICNDQACEQMHDCARWSEQPDPYWRGFSLFLYDIPISDPCPSYEAKESA